MYSPDRTPTANNARHQQENVTPNRKAHKPSQHRPAQGNLTTTNITQQFESRPAMREFPPGLLQAGRKCSRDYSRRTKKRGGGHAPRKGFLENTAPTYTLQGHQSELCRRRTPEEARGASQWHGGGLEERPHMSRPRRTVSSRGGAKRWHLQRRRFLPLLRPSGDTKRDGPCAC